MTDLRARVHALPFAVRLGLAVACLALTGAGGALFLLSPARARAAALEQRQAALEGEINRLRGAAADLAQYRREGGQLHQQVERVAQKLPLEREIPALYRRLYEAASSTDLTVALFQPRDARIQDHYTEIPIALTAEGTYHQLASYLERLADLPRVVTVSALKMTAVERPSASLRVELMLSTYVYRPAGGVRPPSPSPAPVTPAAPRPPLPQTAPSTTAISSPPLLAADPPGPTVAGYTPRGRRDPFGPPPRAPATSAESSPRRQLIASATLTGIVLGPDGPLALVETPDGLGYILRAGDGIDEARVLRIGQDSVVFAVPGANGRRREQIVLALRAVR